MIAGYRAVKGWIAVGVCLSLSAAAEGPAAELTAGCSGGISGGSFGVTLRRAGEIVRWHTPSRHQEPEEIPMRSNPAVTEQLLGEFDAIGFEQIDYQGKGDTTCSLSSGRGDTVHRVSWSIEDSEAPAEVRALSSRILALVDDPVQSEPQPIE